MPENTDPYALAADAAVVLRQDPAHAAARLQYQNALVALGLRAAANRFAGLPPTSEGIIPWTSRRRRFAANLRAAVERWPELAALESTWDNASHDFELHQSIDRNFHILKHSAGEMWRGWMGGLLDHRSFVSQFVFDKSKAPIPPPFAFDGAGHGWFLQHVAAATERSFLAYSCALYLIEPDPIPLCILFHLQDLQPLLRHPRFRLFAGPTALHSLTAALQSHSDWTIPQQFATLRLSAPGTPHLQSTCEELIRQRQNSDTQLLAKVQGRLNTRDLSWWRNRFAHTQPLRVMAITTRYSTVLRYSMEELAAAITAAGHTVELVMEPDDHSLENGLVDKLDRFDPDLILLLSRMRHENPNLPRNIPFVCWDQDNLPCMRTAQTTASLDAFTYVAGHAAVYGQYHLAWPAKNCIPCFPAAAAHRYHPRPLADDETARYACDFSYISNASGSPEALRADLARQWKSNPTGEALFASLSDTILTRSRAGVRFDYDGTKDFITAQAAQLGLSMATETRHEFAVALRTLADRCFRHATLEWVARYCANNNRTLKLYGTGWENHPTLAAHACGRIDPGEALTAVYIATRINLQIIESGLIHSRFLDGIAAGGFFLTREFMLPHERATAEAQYALARRAVLLNITTGGGLRETSDADIRRLWQIVGAAYGDASPDQLTATLRLWHDLAPHFIDLPHVDAIVFNDEAHFAALATRYLEQPDLRRQIASDLRERVLLRHSYDARWKQFLAAVQNGLANP